MATALTLLCGGCCMFSSIGAYLFARYGEEAVLDKAQAKLDKQTRQEKLLEALGDVKSIQARKVTIVNNQPLNIQEVSIYDDMERNMITEEMMTGGYDTESVTFDLGKKTQIPGMIIVNNKDSGGVIGAKVRLLDDNGNVKHESTPIRNVADAYEYDPNFKTWNLLSFVKVGRNEDGTKFS